MKVILYDKGKTGDVGNINSVRQSAETVNRATVMEFFNDLGVDSLKPSLFELVAQEQLRDLLQPALKYVLAVSYDQITLSRVASPHACFIRCLHNGIRDTSCVL